jgi:hypothetical protein
MGARGHVEVETLIAEGSVESLIADLEKKLAWQEKDRINDNLGGDGSGSLLVSATEFQLTKQTFLLKNAKLIKLHAGYLGKNQTIKRKYAEHVSLDAKAENESNNTIPKNARVRFTLD